MRRLEEHRTLLGKGYEKAIALFSRFEPYFWVALLAVQVCINIAINFTADASSLDNDAAKLYTHVVEFCRSGFLFGDWTYMTTLEADCSALLAVPFYLLTKDISLSFAFANTILMGLAIALFFHIGKKCGFRIKHACIAALLLILPYAIGQLEYFNMLFYHGGQYVVKAIVPLLFLDLLLSKNGYSPVDKVVFGLYCFFLLLTTISSGVYVFLCGILPLLSIQFLRIFVTKKETLTLRSALLCGVTLLLTLIGFLVSKLLSANMANDMELFTGDWYSKVVVVLTGFFRLFGAWLAQESIKILTFHGVFRIVLFLFVAFLIGTIVYVAKNIKHDKSGLFAYLLVLFFFNCFVLVFSKMGYVAGFKHRYHIIGAVGLFLLAAFAIKALTHCSEQGIRRFSKAVSLLCAILLVISCNFFAFETLEEKPAAPQQEVCASLQEDVTLVIVYDDSGTAELCRAIDSERIYLNCNEVGVPSGNYDYYLHTNEKSFTDGFETHCMLVLKSKIDDFWSRFPYVKENGYSLVSETEKYYVFRGGNYYFA